MRTQTLASPGGPLLSYGASERSGPPMLILHGVVRSWRSFERLLPSLSERWTLYALDFRGHGESSRVPGAWHVVDYVSDAQTMLRRIGEPALVYGHSLGAMVGAAAAGREPELVRALILEDPPFHTMGSRLPGTPLHRYFQTLRHLALERLPLNDLIRSLADIPMGTAPDGGLIRLRDVRDSAAIRFTAESLIRMDPDVLVPVISGAWLDGYNVESTLAAIKCPAVLIQADEQHGGMLTDNDVALAKKVMSTCIHVRAKGVGHLVHWTSPDLIIQAASSVTEPRP